MDHSKTDGRTLTMDAGDLHRIREALERAETAYATAADLTHGEYGQESASEVEHMRDLSAQYGALATTIRDLLPTDPDVADRWSVTLTTSVQTATTSVQSGS
ncbi:hypothetical protein [Actinomadura atramentaria]|uniref:hypothetical protein n=1 Tax=Actinomadura atramentaria TaxID=1990 RepID=UPI00036EC053|nr:hypothetical protein [Actinomadura atramentaria]